MNGKDMLESELAAVMKELKAERRNLDCALVDGDSFDAYHYMDEVSDLEDKRDTLLDQL